ncbi:MAG: DNA-protecting protein DprA [Phycisphaerales bacterium]|nr:DNA-protecting protein DprA [Phycisphaerales bacterium]
MITNPESRDLLALTLIKGLGPVRIDRLIQAAGSPSAVMSMSQSQLTRVEGIGQRTASGIVTSRPDASARVDDELKVLEDAGCSIVTMMDEHYPPLLHAIPGAPPILQYRGSIDPETHSPTLAMVGSRRCTIYGTEQASRFAGSLASAGFTIVSGGARGIDSAAHLGAINAGGQTLVVLGCGLGHVYPKENAELFDRIVEQGGAIISELPFHTPPSSENFPARNRIISGLSLGTLVIEAGRRSGALITARHAVEDHSREVFAIPGRIDSSASGGSNDLLKSGAHLVTEPGEIIEILERSAAGHLNHGVRHHPARSSAISTQQSSQPSPPHTQEPIGEVDPVGRSILESLSEPKTGDQIAEQLGLEPGQVRAAATMLEIQGRIKRAGSRFERI